MDAKQYLTKLLSESGSYKLTLDDQKTISDHGIKNYIMDKLLSKKFRKTKADPACIERTKNAIQLQLTSDKPLEIVFFQGGYKLWRFPTAPEVDWAEFFNISYLLQYIAPIAAAYKKGINLTYYCHTLLMEKHDNLPTKDIDSYMSSFQKLIDQFQQFTPKNVTIKILKDADIYDRKEYFIALEAGRVRAIEEFKSWPDTKVQDYMRMARLNIKWNGIEDWTKLSDQQKQEKIYLACLYEHAATTSLPKVMDLVKSDNRILLFTKANPIMIGIGSTYSSIAKYWVGYGVLEKRGDYYLPRILTPSQYQASLTTSHDSHSTSIVKGLKNFDSISIYPQEFNFAGKK